MTVIQNITATRTPGTYASAKFSGIEHGFNIGDTVTIHKKGDILFYSFGDGLPGFEEITTRKVYLAQKRKHVALELHWYKKYCTGVTHVNVYYTKLGLFIKPYCGEPISKIVKRLLLDT